MGSWPEIDDATHQNVGAALLSRRWVVATPGGVWNRRIGMAEEVLALRFQCSHAVAVCNGSAALVVALQALGVGPGSRVLLPALTWVGCFTAVLRLGAQPVLCDSTHDRLTANMTEPVREAVDAIISIPLYSQLVDTAAVRKAYPGCPIVLDLSHVSCSPSLGRPLNDADILVSSLQASKVLTCGEGGFAGTDNPILAKRMQGLRTDGRVFVGDPADGGEVLLPHRNLHGANYALSEISAGLLLDQLERIDRQSRRRAAGGQFLLDWFRKLRVEYHADLACVASGLHYGIPVRVKCDPGAMIVHVEDHTGLRLDRCYPPLPEGPLFKPSSEPRYRNIPIDVADVSNARMWHETTVVLPHQVLLESHDTLALLAHCLAETEATSVQRSAHPPTVTVIVLTDGRRDTLGRALASVAAQSYRGQVRVLLVLDRCDPSHLALHDGCLSVQQMRVDLDDCVPTVERVARLRDMALRLCETDLVCFLDDDNQWTHDHLESLYSKMLATGVPAVHCWRRILSQSGTSWEGESFPWLAQGSDGERAQLAICKKLGIIVPGSDVVRDAAHAETPEGDASMVDLGAWLLRTELLRMFGLSARPSGAKAPIDGVGEDDILLAKFKSAAIPIACTEMATLEYSLGGFSNDSQRRAEGWGLI